MKVQRLWMLVALLVVFTIIFLLLLNDRTQFVHSIVADGGRGASFHDPEPAHLAVRQHPPGETPFRRRGDGPAVAREELQDSSTGSPAGTSTGQGRSAAAAKLQAEALRHSRQQASELDSNTTTGVPDIPDEAKQEASSRIFSGRSGAQEAGGGILGKECYPRVFRPATDDPSLPDRCKSQSAGQSTRRPVEHVFFLKTHKTGSSTMRLVFNRYALMRNLTFAARNKGYRSIQAKSNWTGAFVPLPPAVSHYDMLTDHTRFCEACVRALLPADAKFVSIVREPLKQFISGFYYHQVSGKPTGDDAVSTYISDMDRWDQPEGNFLHSRMFFDFGLNFTELHADLSYLPAALDNLTKVFDLVCILERYDESVVLLKRHLAWELRDVLYVKINSNKRKRDVQLTERQVKEFRSRRKEDYALYANFVKEFDRKIAAQGDSFPEEVEVFREIRAIVQEFCVGSKSKTSSEIIVEPTKFSGGFRVAREDCGYLVTPNRIRGGNFDKIMLKRVGIIVE